MCETLASHNKRHKSPYLAGFYVLYCLKDICPPYGYSISRISWNGLGFRPLPNLQLTSNICLTQANLSCFQRCLGVSLISNPIKWVTNWKCFMLIVAAKKLLEDSWYHITSAWERFDFNEVSKYSNPKNAFNLRPCHATCNVYFYKNNLHHQQNDLENSGLFYLCSPKWKKGDCMTRNS